MYRMNNKKVYLTIMAICLIALTVKAQHNKEFNNYYAKPVHIGVKIGLNAFKISGTGFKDKFLPGVVGGAFIQIKLTSRLQVQPELLFSTGKLDTAAEISDAVNYLRFSEEWSSLKPTYINIPILLNIGIGQARGIKLQVGPQYSVLLNKSQTVLSNGQQAFKTGTLDGVVGIMFQAGPVNIAGRYLFGLGNANNINTRANWKSQSIQATIGFMF
jgi:hypothetical protein